MLKHMPNNTLPLKKIPSPIHYQSTIKKRLMEEKLSLATNIKIKRESKPSLLKEAFKITIKNGRLVLFITFILFFCDSLRGLVDHVFLAPVLTDFVSNSLLGAKNGTESILADPTIYKAILKDLRFIIAFKFVEWSFLCLVLMFSVAASVHSTYEAYTAKQLGLKDMLCGLRGKIRRPLKTTIWMILICLASAVLLFFAIGVLGIMIEERRYTLLGTTVLILAAIYYAYVFTLWMLSLVVSVLEENSSGLKAFYQANGLMKGKRLYGFGLMAFLILVTVAMHMTFSTLVSLTATYKVALVGTAISILRIWPYCLLKLFGFAVFTLFYHECKKSQSVEEIPHLYAPVPAAIAEF